MLLSFGKVTAATRQEQHNHWESLSELDVYSSTQHKNWYTLSKRYDDNDQRLKTAERTTAAAHASIVLIPACGSQVDGACFGFFEPIQPSRSASVHEETYTREASLSA